MGKKRLLISTITICALFIIATIAAEGISAGRLPEGNQGAFGGVAKEALSGLQKAAGEEGTGGWEEQGLEKQEAEKQDLEKQGLEETDSEKQELEEPNPEKQDLKNPDSEINMDSLKQREKKVPKVQSFSCLEGNEENFVKEERVLDAILQASFEETKILGQEEPVFQYGYAVANVTEYVNIREGAGTEYALLGRLYKNSYAEIIERGKEWTKVTSGSVTGYIHNDYLLFDEEAVQALQKAGALLAEVTAGTVNLRKGPGTDSEIIKEVKKGNTFPIEPSQCVPEWMAVLYEGGTAYLSSQYVTEKITFSTAISKEEEEKAAAEAAAKAALEKSLLEAKKYTPAETNRTAVDLNDEDLFLLAIVVEMEAASESYQGKLAVANVVINRLLSGKWGKTISSVVYAPNQFSGANSGRIEKFSTRVSEASKKAAVAAAAGENNIGDYLYFRTKSSAKYLSYSKYYILGNHCFYMP